MERIVISDERHPKIPIEFLKALPCFSIRIIGQIVWLTLSYRTDLSNGHRICPIKMVCKVLFLPYEFIDTPLYLWIPQKHNDNTNLGAC